MFSLSDNNLSIFNFKYYVEMKLSHDMRREKISIFKNFNWIYVFQSDCLRDIENTFVPISQLLYEEVCVFPLLQLRRDKVMTCSRTCSTDFSPNFSMCFVSIYFRTDLSAFRKFSIGNFSPIASLWQARVFTMEICQLQDLCGLYR